MISLRWFDSRRERSMMGRLNHEQKQFFYSFRLDDAVPGDHPVRRIAAVLDLAGSIPNWRPVIPGLAVLRSTRF